MKTVKQSKISGVRSVHTFLALGALVLGLPLGVSAIDVVAPLSDTAPQAPAPRIVAPLYSAGVEDVLKMTEAKIDPETIKAFVRNSPTAYNPNVNEIIMLKDHGVSSDIITAMIQHGGEIRARAAQMMAATQQPNYQNVPPSSPYPNPAYAPQQVQPMYPDSSYAYPDNSYGYGYPGSSVVYIGGGYGGYYGWPSSYWGGGYCGYPYWGGYGGWCGYRYPYCGYNRYCGYYGNRYCGFYGNRGFYGAFGARSFTATRSFAGASFGGAHATFAGGGGSFHAVSAGGMHVSGGGGFHGGGGGHR